MRIIYSISIFVALTALACSEPELTYTVEEIDGVRHVHNHAPKWGDDQKIGLEFIRKIGGINTGDKNAQFHNPYDVAIDSKGNLYILDAGNFRVQKFDANGNFLLSVGSKGQGPGEFEGPLKIGVDEEERLYVVDYRNRTLSIFDEQGELQTTVRKEFSLQKFALLKSGHIVINGLYVRGNKNKSEKKLLHIISSSGDIVTSFGTQRKYGETNMQIFGNGLSIGLDNDENIYAAFDAQNRIEKYNPEGKLLFRVTRELPYKESESTRSSSMRGGSYISYNKFFAGIQADHKNRLWVETIKRQETEKDKQDRRAGKGENLRAMEIYDKDGTLLSRLKGDVITTGQDYRIIHDRLFILDYGREAAVFEYKIVNK